MDMVCFSQFAVVVGVSRALVKLKGSPGQGRCLDLECGIQKHGSRMHCFACTWACVLSRVCGLACLAFEADALISVHGATTCSGKDYLPPAWRKSAIHAVCEAACCNQGCSQKCVSSVDAEAQSLTAVLGSGMY